MSDQYYRFFPGDYQRDTGDLSMVEHGAYRLLLDHYYMRGNLPSDRNKLYRLCRAFDDIEREAVEMIVDIFFIDDGECLINKKAEEEIEKRNGYLDEQARKSRLGVEARRKLKEEPTGQPTGMPEGVPLPLPSPLPLPKPIKDKKGDNKKSPPSRTKYLDSVLLSEDEYKKLQVSLGQASLDTGIEQLDYSITVKGGKYKDHYKTILNWNKRGFLTGGNNGTGKQYDKKDRNWADREAATEADKLNARYRAVQAAKAASGDTK